MTRSSTEDWIFLGHQRLRWLYYTWKKSYNNYVSLLRSSILYLTINTFVPEEELGLQKRKGTLTFPAFVFLSLDFVYESLNILVHRWIIKSSTTENSLRQKVHNNLIFRCNLENVTGHVYIPIIYLSIIWSYLLQQLS